MIMIYWTQHASNEQVLGLLDESCSLLESLRKRQKNWIAHVLRHDYLLQEVIEEGGFRERKSLEDQEQHSSRLLPQTCPPILHLASSEQ